MSTLRSEQEVKERPNISRNFVDLMPYRAGVVLLQPYNSGLPLSQIFGRTAPSLNGCSATDNNFVMDGVQNNSKHQSQGVMVFPEIEALEQYPEFFNVTNTPRFNNPASNIRSPAAGRITKADSENRFQRSQRLLQFGLRFVF